MFACLWPPTVEDGEVRHTVHYGLHPRGPTGLHGPNRRVQPHVHPTGHGQAGGHGVVLQKGDRNVLELLRRGEDLLDQPLAPLVAGVCFPREDELDLAAPDFIQPLDVPEDQGGSLVGGESACEADRQPIAVQLHPRHRHRQLPENRP